MATSESEIRKGVSVLLSQYGTLNTTEVKQLLDTVIPFDEDDLQPSQTRSEPLIIQRIGNIVSHQSENLKIYNDTYSIDKSVKPAIWSILTGLKSNNTLKQISDAQRKVKQNIRSQFSPKKIDWTTVNSSRSELGRMGEEFAVRYETNRVLAFAPQDADRIIHLSIEQGDGAGFDIISLNEDGSERYIEVKTTVGGLDTPFYMSENERAFFDLHKDIGDLYIYRIYNFDTINKKGELKIISADILFSDYKFDPISYKVTKKYSNSD